MLDEFIPYSITFQWKIKFNNFFVFYHFIDNWVDGLKEW